MNIGKLDQRITFQRITATPDGIGGTTRAWANLVTNATVAAAVKARPGREGVVDGRMTATTPTTFTIYWRDDVSEVDRIMWDGIAYQIRNVMRQGGRKLYLEIDAERGVAS